MAVKLNKPWRYWLYGCVPVDYTAGAVIEDETIAAVALQCGVVEEAPAPKKGRRQKETRQ